VLAHRLSEDPARNVLLLEAGEAFSPDDFPDMLADADQLGGDSECDWGYYSEPGRLGYPYHAQSGKVLGGGSSINAGAAKRVRPSDFARWQCHGVEGWWFEGRPGDLYRAGKHAPAAMTGGTAVPDLFPSAK
jgi:choline dehydrogenase